MVSKLQAKHILLQVALQRGTVTAMMLTQLSSVTLPWPSRPFVWASVSDTALRPSSAVLTHYSTAVLVFHKSFNLISILFLRSFAILSHCCSSFLHITVVVSANNFPSHYFHALSTAKANGGNNAGYVNERHTFFYYCIWNCSLHKASDVASSRDAILYVVLQCHTSSSERD